MKKIKNIMIIFIKIAIHGIIGSIIGIIMFVGTICVLDEIKLRFFTSSILKSNSHIYTEVTHLDEICWGRCLKYLSFLKSNDEIKKACMIIGYKNNQGHAWIRYKYKDKIVEYDPSNNIAKIINFR